MDESTLKWGPTYVVTNTFFGCELVENLWNDHCAHHINESFPTIPKLLQGAQWFGVG
jgi:hypothetical protein